MATFTRRRLLALSAGSGLAFLAGCRPARRGTLVCSAGSMPQSWTSKLPGSWGLRSVASPQAVLAASAGGDGDAGPAELVMLGDGWATTTPADRFAPLGSSVQPLLDRLDPLAGPISRLLAPVGAPARAFPWSFGTWVLLVRRRPDLIAKAHEGWSLLLDPSLRGRLVLPSSPRVVISLLAGPAPLSDPALADRLRQLRRQALAFDDRDGLNLLLAADADAVVLPSQRAVSLLRRDPRLQAVLPAGGSPLIWNLLLRPAASTQLPPIDWLDKVLRSPLLARLLADGWVPPLPLSSLQPLLDQQPGPIRALLRPPQALLDRCYNLAPLPAAQRNEAQALWDGAAPG